MSMEDLRDESRVRDDAVDGEHADPGSERPHAAPPRPTSGFLGLVTPSYLLCFAILGAMVAAAGLWEVIANTRLLAVFISGGIVALGEDDPGLGTGVPGVHYFIRSQEPIVWTLLVLAAALFVVIMLLKGTQFHRVAQCFGVNGTFGEHLRAYIYGHSIGRLTPYRMGDVALASALEGQGNASVEQAARTVFAFKGFTLFEIGTFALIGLFMNGLLGWATSLVPPLTILLVSWLLLRTFHDRDPAKEAFGPHAAGIFGQLTRDPQMLVGLVLLSLVSFALVEFATYIIPQAFSTRTVPLVQDALLYVVVTPPVVVMAVVGGYAARLIPITPGGVGQFELAFAGVLMVNELPLTEAVTLALLVSLVRYTTGLAVFGLTMLIFGIETNFERVRRLFAADDVSLAKG